ncbi:LacI family DNA-binding transcriptional regulator [Pseudonocardia oroxyli]|nr:LacI family DNA-binding transcriptional regulator [Pseudonocardia oroxyli]
MPGRGPRRPVSMADVAQLAGVSVTTVSHVVNRTRTVAAATEQAVRSAIAESGYVPDNVTRSLRSAGSRVVGLAMSAISNPYFGDVVHGIDRAATRQGYSLLLADTHDDVDGELRAVSDLLGRGVEAIVLAPSADPSTALRHARHRDVPVVLIDRFSDAADTDQIGGENVEATALLVEHLATIGHTRIAMISGQPGLGTTQERLEGYRLGLHRHGLTPRPGYIVTGHSSGEAARATLNELLTQAEPPTAVVVGNNQMTIGAMRAVRDAGINVPRDLALVAFDDFEWADLFHPRLTVIAQPTQALGEQALQLVLSRLADPGAPARRVVMKPTFVHRDSCGCGQDSPTQDTTTPL